MQPLKTKIFDHCTSNITPPGEVQINAWLAENPHIEIVQMLQSESMASHDSGVERNLTITLFYRQAN